MVHLLKQEALTHGDKLQILSVKRLTELQTEIDIFRKNDILNDFQNWIVNHLYQFEVPIVEFPIKSIIIIAIPHPSYAKVELVQKDQKYYFLSLVMSDFENTEKYLESFLKQKNYHLCPASNIPLKRLAAKCGLAVYGRNNICYVEGMGSFFSLAAFFSDIPCDTDDWAVIGQAKKCTGCNICFKMCPTGAIREDRFLINNERCLSYLNETPGDFPEWVPLSSHHTLYDCLKCQIACPMNKEFVNHILDSIQFSEEETEMLLSGIPFDTFSPGLQRKSKILGLDQWLDAIPRNLKLLFELSKNRS